MFNQILQTLKVLTDGPSSLEEEKVLDLYFDPETMHDAIADFLTNFNQEANDLAILMDLVKYCVSIDANVSTRLSHNEPSEEEDGKPLWFAEGKTDKDYFEYLEYLDKTFSISAEALGINQYTNSDIVADSALPPGLCGTLLYALESDEDNSFSIIVELLKDACETNPCIGTTWWLDFLNDIYSGAISLEADLLYCEYGESPAETVERWYLKLTKVLHALIAIRNKVNQTMSPNSLVCLYLTQLGIDMGNVADSYGDVGYICEKCNELADLKQPTTIEDLLMSLFTYMAEM